MGKTTMLHLSDTDMIVFIGLTANKMEKLRLELLNQGFATSKELEDLKALKDQLLNGAKEITSYNTF